MTKMLRIGLSKRYKAEVLNFASIFGDGSRKILKHGYDVSTSFQADVRCALNHVLIYSQCYEVAS